MSIFELLTKGEQTLKQAFAGAPTYHQPKIDAQVLLSIAIGKPTAYLFTHFDDPVTDAQINRYEALLARRSSMEPIAYITGKKAFFGREFEVTTDTLIPRPDTELIIEDALDTLSQASRASTPEHSASSNADAALLVDVGTGSGAIGITIAAELSKPVICIDLSKEALAIARKNAKLNKTEALTHFLHGNLLEPMFLEDESYADFDSMLLFANLPYLSRNQYDALEPGVKTFEPKQALVSGVDGLDHYRALFYQLDTYAHLLPAHIRVYCEIDSSQRRGIIALAESHGANHFVIKKDLERRDRLAIFTFDSRT